MQQIFWPSSSTYLTFDNVVSIFIAVNNDIDASNKIGISNFGDVEVENSDFFGPHFHLNSFS
jgi:hypothetical protein